MGRLRCAPHWALAVGLCLAFPSAHAAAPLPPPQILNVSYDPTRELYRDFNAAFAKYWRDQTGETVRILMSHAGSSEQARAVIDGIEADVVTLGSPVDIDEIAARTNRIPAEWQERLPNHSAPYSSTIVFLVRRGNPKHITDWADLANTDVAIVAPNPKTSSGAKWIYLAAWIYALEAEANDETAAKNFVAKLYRHVGVMDSGARASATSFAQRGIGDVLLTWENEAYLLLAETGAQQFEIIVPSLSVRAEPPVALVDANVDEHGTRRIAEAYLRYLYAPEGQRIIARHYLRPVSPEFAAAEDIARFKETKLVRAEEVLGDLRNVVATHFGSNGIFDQIYLAGH